MWGPATGDAREPHRSIGKKVTRRNTGLQRLGLPSQKVYVGQDRFVLEVGGENMDRRVFRGTSHVTVDVDVVH